MTDSQAQAWESEVIELATTLRALGIDVDVDLYHLDDIDVDWTRFGPERVRSSTFVLIAASTAWRERWDGSNNPTHGAGAAVEADTLKGIFNVDQMAFQRKAKVVLLDSQTVEDVPPELHRLQRFRISSSNPDTALTLVRSITGQPKHVKPPLGSIPTLPPVFERHLSPQAKREQVRGVSEGSRMLNELRRTDALLKGELRLPKSRSLDIEPVSDDDLAGLTEAQHFATRRLLQRRSALQGILDSITLDES